MIIGSVQLVNLGLKAWIFTQADVSIRYPQPETIKEDAEVKQPSEEELEAYEEQQLASRREREAAQAIAFVVIGTPLYFYYWSIVRKGV